MNKEKLEKANELAGKIKSLESYISKCKDGIVRIKLDDHMYVSSSFNEILLPPMIASMEKELARLKDEFEKL